MASVTLDAGSRLDASKVIEQTFAVLGRNLVPFGLAAAILVGIPAVLLGILQLSDLAHPTSGESFSKSGGGFITAFCNAILQAGVIHGVVRDMSGERATLKDCLTVGWKRWTALLGLSIIAFLGILIGLVLLVVPGVIIALAWSVAVPVRVMEGLGVWASLRRSAELTRGRRGTILSIGLFVSVFYVIVGAIVYGLTGGFAKAEFGFAGLILLSPIIKVASSLFGSVIIAVLYEQLRQGREGVSVESLAEVFD
jgi:hypothetical protein